MRDETDLTEQELYDMWRRAAPVVLLRRRPRTTAPRAVPSPLMATLVDVVVSLIALVLAALLAFGVVAGVLMIGSWVLRKLRKA